MSTKTYHHGNLREELISEAMKTLNTHGIEAITMRQLSKSLGVSKTAPYRHFQNKSALLTAVAAEGFRKMRILFDKFSYADDPESTLSVIMERYIAFAVTNPKLYKLMFSREIYQLHVSDELEKAATEAYSGVAATLNAIHSQDDASVNINTAWALVHGLSLLINENILTVNDHGKTAHALLSYETNPTTEQISNQVSSSIALFIKGLSTASQKNNVQKAGQ